MLIFLFYLFGLGYTALFSYIFNIFGTLSYFDILWVALLLVLCFVLSFLTILLIIQVMVLLRRNKPKNDVFNHHFANITLKLALHIMRTKVIVTGKENIPEGPFVLVGNHQENYDIIILKPIFEGIPLDFIAKEALKNVPILGRWISILGNVYISRFADRSAAKSIIQGIKNVREGIPMGIFPEGKRTFGNEMIDFKPGAFKLAMKPKADLLIATQYDTCKIFKSFPWKKYKVKVHIHPIIKYDEYQALNSHELADKVKAIIQEQLDKFATETN